MKLFYELYHPPLASKKPRPPKPSHPTGNVAWYESGYSTALLDIEQSKMLSDSPSNIWVIDSGASNHMVPLNKSCFTDYSTDLPGPKGINGDTKILGISIITLTTSNGGELVLRDVLHARIALFSFIPWPTDDGSNTMLFSDPHYIIENSTGFHIESKFAPIFGTTSSLFRFRVNFPLFPSNELQILHQPSRQVDYEPKFFNS